MKYETSLPKAFQGPVVGATNLLSDLDDYSSIMKGNKDLVKYMKKHGNKPDKGKILADGILKTESSSKSKDTSLKSKSSKNQSSVATHEFIKSEDSNEKDKKKIKREITNKNKKDASAKESSFSTNVLTAEPKNQKDYDTLAEKKVMDSIMEQENEDHTPIMRKETKRSASRKIASNDLTANNKLLEMA